MPFHVRQILGWLTSIQYIKAKKDAESLKYRSWLTSVQCIKAKKGAESLKYKCPSVSVIKCTPIAYPCSRYSTNIPISSLYHHPVSFYSYFVHEILPLVFCLVFQLCACLPFLNFKIAQLY